MRRLIPLIVVSLSLTGHLDAAEAFIGNLLEGLACTPAASFRANCQLPLLVPFSVAGAPSQQRVALYPPPGVFLGDVLTDGPSLALGLNGGTDASVGMMIPNPSQSNIVFSCNPGVVVRSVRLPLRLEAAREYAKSVGKTALAERMQADAALGFIEWLMFSGRVPGCFDDALSLVGGTRDYVLGLVKAPTPHTLLALWEQWLREGGRP